MKIQYSSTNNFQTKLFNVTVNEYFDTVFKELVKQYLLTSAKGGSGFGFEHTPNLQESIIKYEDMPYHIHILNGMIPALKIYEKELQRKDIINHEDIPDLLRVLLIGFTFHDLNKLVDKSLNEGVREDLSRLCKELKVGLFFEGWEEWLNELSYIILCTEKRTSGYALNYDNLKNEYIGKTLRSVSRLADIFASQSTFDDVADFYQSISKIKYQYDRLDEIMGLSYVSISSNIYTLLSQKLLQAAQNYILGTRDEDILFQLRNGFVFVGKSLSKEEQEIIIDNFVNDDSNFDAIGETKIDFQEVNFGFQNTRPLTPNILSQILKEGFTTRRNINFFTVNKEFKKVVSDDYEWLCDYLDEYELPFSAFLSDKEKKKNLNAQEATFLFSDDYLQNKESALIANLFGLQKIKFKKLVNANWTAEFNNTIQNNSDIFGTEEMPKQANKGYSRFTLIPLVSVVDMMEQDNFDLELTYENTLKEVCEELSKSVKIDIEATAELTKFAKTYLNGNFEIDFDEIFNRSLTIPTKDQMCIFTGQQSFDRYATTNAYAVSVLGFNNRTKNILKDHDNYKNQLSFLFKCELDLRKILAKGISYNQLKKLTSCVYFDFGEYIVHLNKDNAHAVLNRIAQSTEATYNSETLQVEVTKSKNKLDFNLYNVSYRNIEYNIDGNVRFVFDCLKIIGQTGLRIFTTGIISPYITHKEIFVFENSLPIIKKLGWDRVRIDEIKIRIQEIQLLKSLSRGKTKQVVSTSLVLGYSQNVRAVFTAYATLDDKNKKQANKLLNSSIHILKRFRNYDMSTMKQLAEIARQMVQPKSSTASQSSRIIRDALDIVKKLYKEGKTSAEYRDTNIGQISGAMEQILRTNQGNSDFVQPFAENVYDELFVKEWNRSIPNTNRIRDWINEFAFWYKAEDKKDSERINQLVVNKAIKSMRKEAIEVTEDTVIDWLKQSKSNENKAIDNYEKEYRIAYQTIISKS